jgi:hypothetical protein
VLGQVRVRDRRLIFRPRYPFKPGLSYRVVVRLAEPIEAILHIPDNVQRDPTVIEAVYPSSDVLPENLLKFYVHFSAPMAQGDAYSHVRLLDEHDKEVEYPFVNVGQELWDRSGRRVTLLLDPGRIKRGLRPREEVGPILVEGSAYTLVIDAAWPDADGRPLKESMRKTFRASAPDDVQPDPATWRLEPPRAKTSEPLEVRFQEPLDHAMLSSAFAIFDERRAQVTGKIETGDEEKLWRFVPDGDWLPGDYTVVVDAALEDRAGNSIEKPFEVDVFEKVESHVTNRNISIPFRVASSETKEP